ncbi:MAG: hypothetical protein AAFQ45_06820 [Pseudomonadota bacterium]
MAILTDEKMRKAMRAINAARQGAVDDQRCPDCNAQGLLVEDRSARPHAEWYQLTCSACGFDEAIQIPLGTTPITLD